MDRKVLVGIGAGVFLAATLVGALFIEASNDPAPRLAFPLTWTTEEGPATTQRGELQEGENETVPVGLSARNVTEVQVRLVWQDDGGERDRFRLTVAPPDGPERSNESRNGSIVLRFRLGSVPVATTVNGTTHAEAVERATSRFSSSQGTGNWTTRVTLLEAPGVRPVAEAPQLETQPDGNNTYRLRFSYESYRAQVGPQPRGR